MKIRSFLLRIIYFDGTVLYRSCDSYNEVVAYMKKEEVISVFVCKTSAFSQYGTDIDQVLNKLLLEYENKG